jgi:putative two-component system response regulator
MGVERKTIFLVDDDMTNLVTSNNTLAEFYNIFTFNSGARLLKTLERHIPDLILLDVEMPEMNGYEVIRQLKANPVTKSIPVIFLTMRNDPESELEGLSLGAIDYISKPFTPVLLLKRIELHLLVMSQKQELVNHNANLQKLVANETQTVVELKNAVLKTMAELVEYRDGITGGHIDRTQSYMEVLLEEINKSDLYKEETSSWDIALVLQSAQLHDVGKIVIDDRLLRKPGRLTKEEFEKIKMHTTFGEKVIKKLRKNTSHHIFLNYALVFAGTHHEKWDGSGYHRGLSGENIPLLGRLMAIADVYDALVSDRPYKKAFSHEAAVDIIKADSGTHFDPALVELFLNVADKFQALSEFHKTQTDDKTLV